MKTVHAEEGHPLALFPTFMAMVAGSVDACLFQRLYVLKEGLLVDVIDNGDLACAFFVSSLLCVCGLTQGGAHTTVEETVCDMVASGWCETNNFRPGSVLVWDRKVCTDERLHGHVGVYVGDHTAISHNSDARTPIRHHYTFGTSPDGQPVRRVKAVYWHSLLDD